MRHVRIRFGLLFLIVSSFLVGCGGATDDEQQDVGSDAKFIELSTILTMGGYHMVEQGPAKVFQFNNDEIYERFDIEVELFQLYIGEKDGSDKVYMAVFWEMEDAVTYEEAYLANPDLEDRYFHREEEIVILTYSDDVMDLLD
jgi:hypothetical protein